MLLAVDLSQYIWLGVLFLLLIAFFVYTYFRNKRDQERFKSMTESIEKGDKILTASGIIGKVVSIENKDNFKYITVETGDNKNKGYLTIDSQAIYAVLEKKNQPVVNAPVEEVKQEEVQTEQIEQTEQPAKEETEKPVKKTTTRKKK